MDDLEQMRRAAAITAALAHAPGPVTLLNPRPLVKVRVTYGRAIAVTPTHVLHEWVRYREWHCRWDAKRLVERVEDGVWLGEEID